MPDVHLGYGATVGSVIPTDKAIIPAAVGVDIGCGMMAARTSLTANDLPDSLRKVRRAIERQVPHGRSKHGGAGDVGRSSHRDEPGRARPAAIQRDDPRAARRRQVVSGLLGRPGAVGGGLSPCGSASRRHDGWSEPVLCSPASSTGHDAWRPPRCRSSSRARRGRERRAPRGRRSASRTCVAVDEGIPGPSSFKRSS